MKEDSMRCSDELRVNFDSASTDICLNVGGDAASISNRAFEGVDGNLQLGRRYRQAIHPKGLIVVGRDIRVRRRWKIGIREHRVRLVAQESHEQDDKLHHRSGKEKEKEKRKGRKVFVGFVFYKVKRDAIFENGIERSGSLDNFYD
jgi:hypothetical protein